MMDVSAALKCLGMELVWKVRGCVSIERMIIKLNKTRGR